MRSRKAELVIGAVLVPGAAAPKLVTRDMLKTMKRGSVLVDIAIDQGGCFETSHATTHADPVYEVDGVIHYCVANMPGAVARTCAFALNNATLPFALKIANLGAEKAMRQDPHLAAGLNVSGGKIRHQAVAEALGSALRAGLATRRARRRLSAATPCSTSGRQLAFGGRVGEHRLPSRGAPRGRRSGPAPGRRRTGRRVAGRQLGRAPISEFGRRGEAIAHGRPARCRARSTIAASPG